MFAAVGDSVSIAGFVIPPFWLGILLVLLFAIWLRWIPASGYVYFTADPWGHVERLFMPLVTLAIPTIALYYNYLRQSLKEALASQYVRTARAKGISESRMLYRHALPNALLPSLTVLGIQFGQLLGGVVIIERVFNWPGVGGLLLYSQDQQDYATLVGVRARDRHGVRRDVDADRDRVPPRRSPDASRLMGWLRGNRRLQVGLILLVPFLVLALLPGVFAPHGPNELIGVPFAKPSTTYWLGTDDLGRDTLSRLIYAAREDIKISLDLDDDLRGRRSPDRPDRRLSRRRDRRHRAAGDRRDARLPLDPARAVPDRDRRPERQGRDLRARRCSSCPGSSGSRAGSRSRSASAASSRPARSRAGEPCTSHAVTFCRTRSGRSSSASR